MTVFEFLALFNSLPHEVRVELARELDEGRVLEAQRILVAVTGNGLLASEAVAAVVRYQQTGRKT